MRPPPEVSSTPPAQLVQDVAALVRAVLPADARLLIGVHPGSGRVTKCWPAAHFGRLAGMLADRLGATVLLFGGPDDMELARSVLRHAPPAAPVVSLAGRLSLAQFDAAVRCCHLFLGNDSGPTHIAAATGIPVLGIYAGTADPRQWGPLGPNAAAIQRALLCSPCYCGRNRDCPIGLPCTRQLHPEVVFEAAVRMLLPHWDKLRPGFLPSRGHAANTVTHAASPPRKRGVAEQSPR